MKNIHVILHVVVLVVLVLILLSVLYRPARICDVKMLHTFICARSGCHSNATEIKACFLNFLIYLLTISVVLLVSFRWFRFVVSGFSACPFQCIFEHVFRQSGAILLLKVSLTDVCVRNVKKKISRTKSRGLPHILVQNQVSTVKWKKIFTSWLTDLLFADRGQELWLKYVYVVYKKFFH